MNRRSPLPRIAANTMSKGVALVALGLAATLAAPGGRASSEPWHSPYDLAFSPDGTRVAVSDRTGSALWLIHADRFVVEKRVVLQGRPTGVAWSGDSIFVAEFGAGTVAVVDANKGVVRRRVSVDRHPEGVAVAEKRGLLLVANPTTHRVSLVDLRGGGKLTHVDTPREPFRIAVTPDERLAVVGNLLPAGVGTDPNAASVISILDLERRAKVKDVRLPAGSTAVREIAIGRDGRFAYVAHVVGRTHVPSTQLERGWVNTNALSIIDLQAQARFATVLLDNPLRGAADPWGVALAGEGKRLFVGLSGVHEIASLDLAKLHVFLRGELPAEHRLAGTGGTPHDSESIWSRIRRDPSARSGLEHDLAALTSAELIDRIPVGGKGPRGLAVSPNGKLLAAAVYFGSRVVFFDAETLRAVGSVPLGDAVEPDLARRGEILFHDATNCFQHWLSCGTCHPNDGRVDGLNWDQPQDGIGNPKNNKSLLHAQHTAPMTWRGVRSDMDSSVAKGFVFMMRQPEPGDLDAVRAYIRSLQPLPSPHLAADGSLSAAAERGHAIFHEKKTRCARCHSGPHLTDQKMHSVGTRGERDRSGKFDTPGLVELYRTAPYLHDGSAPTLRAVLRDRNASNKHGRTAHLTEQQLDDLLAYLRSL